MYTIICCTYGMTTESGILKTLCINFVAKCWLSDWLDTIFLCFYLQLLHIQNCFLKTHIISIISLLDYVFCLYQIFLNPKQRIHQNKYIINVWSSRFHCVWIRMCSKRVFRLIQLSSLNIRLFKIKFRKGHLVTSTRVSRSMTKQTV